MRAPWRGKFDPDRKDFTVRRKLTVAGVTHYPGQDFDPTLVNVRRRRQLFDHRSIVYAGTNPGEIIEAHSKRKVKVKAPSDPFPDRTLITIPDDWATLKWPKRLSLATSLTEEKVHNNAEAVAAIEAEIARRAELP